MLNWSATRCEDSRLRLLTLTISTPSIACTPGMCRTRVLLPAPTMPTLIGAKAIWFLLCEDQCDDVTTPPMPLSDRHATIVAGQSLSLMDSLPMGSRRTPTRHQPRRSHATLPEISLVPASQKPSRRLRSSNPRRRDVITTGGDCSGAGLVCQRR